MRCECPCGNGYEFDPLGFWICHKCGSVNDSGSLGGKRGDAFAPDRVDEFVDGERDFSARADAAVRANPDSWEAWYSLGAAYGARGNVLEAGLIWTKAVALAPEDEKDGLLERCAARMAENIFRGVVTGDRCNTPYVRGLEILSKGRLDRSFCLMVYERMLGLAARFMPREAYSLANLGLSVMMQGISVHPDIRDHRRMLEEMTLIAERPVSTKSINPLRKAADKRISGYMGGQADAFRMAANAIASALESYSGDVSELAAIQPSDGSAGFADVLSKAMFKGSEAAFLKASKASDAEIAAVESETRDLVGRYVSMFMDGDASAVPENRAYTG